MIDEIKQIDRYTFNKLCEIVTDCVTWNTGEFDKESFEISLRDVLNIEVVVYEAKLY
jgi:hypothetical protein